MRTSLCTNARCSCSCDRQLHATDSIRILSTVPVVEIIMSGEHANSPAVQPAAGVIEPSDHEQQHRQMQHPSTRIRDRNLGLKRDAHGNVDVSNLTDSQRAVLGMSTAHCEFSCLYVVHHHGRH